MALVRDLVSVESLLAIRKFKSELEASQKKVRKRAKKE